MLNAVRQIVPSTWNDAYSDQSDVPSHSEEFLQVSFEIRQAFSGLTAPAIRRLIRVQDLHSYGQFLIREQLLINSNMTQLYRVRRFIQLNRSQQSNVIRYNLDPRRCGMVQSTITFEKTLSFISSSNIVVVVKALTTEPGLETLTPKTSCDFYVEYVAEF